MSKKNLCSWCLEEVNVKAHNGLCKSCFLCTQEEAGMDYILDHLPENDVLASVISLSEDVTVFLK